ncbi:MAG: hypothetical protein QG557_394, partial [Pseudomonadota bacterium]|nr:hypothetical protein [Pseudomonadota bacterium]
NEIFGTNPAFKKQQQTFRQLHSLRIYVNYREHIVEMRLLIQIEFASIFLAFNSE